MTASQASRQSQFFSIFVNGVHEGDVFDIQDLAECIGNPAIDRIDIMTINHDGPHYNAPQLFQSVTESETVQNYIALMLGS